MTEYSIEYSPAARIDLKGIYSYIAFHLKERTTARNRAFLITIPHGSLKRSEIPVNIPAELDAIYDAEGQGMVGAYD